MVGEEIMKKSTITVEQSEYCKVCGGCGYIGCCGIANFLKEHVVGKTNCVNEGMFVMEILECVNDSLLKEMQLTSKQIQKISGVTITYPKSLKKRKS
jgi:Na+-translocating ferredoxin:NAD+ oxidoreductase RNF subunit RnfB